MTKSDFDKVADEWVRSQLHLSYTRKNSYYETILASGADALPFIYQRLLDGERLSWFLLLHEITGENPIPHEDRGYVKKMADHWINLLEKMYNIQAGMR